MSTWLTAPFESNESSNLVMGSVKTDVEKFRTNPRFHFRIEMDWKYSPAAKGMPSEVDSQLMEKVQEAFEASFKKDPVAVLTEIFTGEGMRTFVFYTLSLHIFQHKVNEVLEPFPQLPLEFSASDDPEWADYTSTLTLAQADDDEEDTSTLSAIDDCL